jgi:hypothetical protein
VAQARLGFTQLSSSSVLKELPLSATERTYKRGCVGAKGHQPQRSQSRGTLRLVSTQPYLRKLFLRTSPISRSRIPAMNRRFRACVLECGGKRSATPLSNGARIPNANSRPRRITSKSGVFPAPRDNSRTMRYFGRSHGKANPNSLPPNFSFSVSPKIFRGILGISA